MPFVLLYTQVFGCCVVEQVSGQGRNRCFERYGAILFGHAAVFVSRGQAKITLGDYQGAFVDCTEALKGTMTPSSVTSTSPKLI
jgi:hypothetical protein